MVVGTARIQLAIPGCRSLKDKRRHIKGLIQRVQSRFGVSCAEVGDQNIWQRTVLGVAYVSTTGAHAESVLSSVVSFIDRGPLEIMDYTVTVL